ncbi:MAG: hypothetical protein XU15_C0022G0014 [candidate division NC10 bacterium CSP1-5]|nr:MAG: hypothetical protein XU15_C0022G0014 [candidate division NC10 bacterium CSP1-5]
MSRRSTSAGGTDVPPLSQAPLQGGGPDGELRIPPEFSVRLECGKGADSPLAYPLGLSPLPEVLRHYAQRLEVPFSFLGNQRRYARPSRGEAITVHHFALPTPPILLGLFPRVPEIRIPFAFGYPLAPSAQHGFPPGSHIGRGRTLRDEEGRAVAEIAKGNIYVLFNLLGQDGELRPLLLRRLLDLSLPRVLTERRGLSPLGWDPLEATLETLRQETEETAAGWDRRRQAKVRQAYVQECRSRVHEEMAFLEQEMRLLEENLEEYARRITAETRRLSTYRERLNTLRGTAPSQAQHLKELDDLKELPEVREVQVQDGRITVFTAPIHAEYEGREFCLGSYRIEISLAGDIRIWNLTSAVGAYDHPHIYQGRPCLGNAREGIAKLIGEYQFVALVYVILDFLKTVNSKDWRVPIVYWQESRS